MDRDSRSIGTVGHTDWTPGRGPVDHDEPMAFGFLDRFRRTTEPPRSTPATRAAAERLAAWSWLDDDRRDRLVADGGTLARELRWEAAQGFDVDDEIRSTIAVHAALLTLELGVDSYRNVSSVIVHPSTIELHGEHSIGHGLVADEPVDLSGEAHHRGPVLIAWDTARYQARHPDRGHNVILHEFAHHLDMLDGWVDGMPPLRSRAQATEWQRVMTDEYERLRAASDEGRATLLDEYGATNPGEFFAVATEFFFERSVELRASSSGRPLKIP